MDAAAESSSHAASFTNGMRIRLTMNPGLSFRTRTGSLPRSSARAATRSSVAGAVSAPAITSTSGILTGGLKKCIPQKRSGRSVTDARSVIERLDVFDTRIASSEAYSSADAYTSALIERCSGTASTITSASPTAAFRSTTGSIRSRVLSTASSSRSPRSSSRSSDHSIDSYPSSTYSRSTSRIVTA